MAIISKNSKVSINGKETRYVMFPNDVVVLNDEECNVWGYGREGKFWFQREKGTDIVEPYLTHDENGNEVPLKWWYKRAVERGEEFKSLYRLYYRCIVEWYNVDKRTIWYDGQFSEFNAHLTDAPSAVNNGRVYVPTAHLFELDFNLDTLLYGVESDNPFETSHAHFNSKYDDGRVAVRCVATDEEIDRRRDNIDLCITEIDALISKYVGVKPNDVPLTIEQKLKVAKVVYAWIENETNFTLPGKWEEQTLYATFSRGEMDTLCTSRTYATHVIFERYGINHISMVTPGHTFSFVSYDSNLYEYKLKDSEWCIFDSQQGRFNIPLKESESHAERIARRLAEWWSPEEDFPTTNPSDDRYSYIGPSGEFAKDENGKYIKKEDGKNERVYAW